MTRILVIDDEEVVRDLIVTVLARAGYEALGTGPADARALLDDPALALVVSDVRMPGLSGLDLAGELRARARPVPVLLVTGAGSEDARADALARGAHGLLLKPFNHAELLGAVAAALAGGPA